MAVNSIFEVYCSRWLHGFGRFISVITVQNAERPKDILAEVFLFAPDADDVFKGKILRYNYHAGDENVDKFDFDFMKAEAINQAKCLVQKCQSEHYQKNKDVHVFTGTPDFMACNLSTLAILRENASCMKHLKDVAIDTSSEMLRAYVTGFLSDSRVEIRDYKK